MESGKKHEQISAQRIFNPGHFKFCRAMNNEDRDKVANDFMQASLMAVRSGFDCLEIHCGHGYLISQYLSPKLNGGVCRYKSACSGFVRCLDAFERLLIRIRNLAVLV